MAASQEQKLDYLLKKIGYSATKTGIAEDESSLSGTKKAPFGEAIPSPLVVPSSSVWRDSSFIPGTPPGATTTYVRVYATASAHRMTVDATVSGNRTFIAYSTYNDTSTAILGDWIDPSFGADYIIKVYAGDPNSGGTLLSASGSGSNDTWFFDYSSGVLNFNGTSVPSGVTSSNIYLVGYRYLGVKGVGLNSLGNTFYVAENGSDTSSGNTINDAYLTVAKALSVASSGDIINVSAGTFAETCPLTVPAGVTVKGAGLRATTIKPTDATKTNNIFLLNNASTLEDFTIKDSFYNSSTDTGYAFSCAGSATISTRSPYIQRITVFNKGSDTSISDPYGFDTADNPPTTYVSGRGAFIDGQNIASSSLEAGMLFNEVTFFTPNQKGVILTNGARAEYLNCFHYFASRAIEGLSGSVGIAGTARVRLKFDTPSVTLNVNDVVKLRDSGGTVVGLGTVVSYDSPYAEISGKGHGTFTVGAGTTQDVKFYQSDGTTQTGFASAISLADYTKFGAEMRSVGCAFEYGTQGVVADGIGVKLRLFATNFNHVGSGKDFTNDSTLTIQANEVVELNSGKVSFVSIDQSGDFRVGDAFVVQQETGNVSFASTTYNLETTGNLTVTDGGSNQSQLSPTSLTVGDLQLAASTVSSSSGDITLDPAGSNKTIVSGDLSVTGNSTLSGSLDVDGQSDLDVLNVAETATFSSNVDIDGDLDVDGHTNLDNVSIAGVVTATAFHTGAEGSALRVTSNTISGPATITIDPAGVGDNTGTVVIAGDLQVDGTETIVNSTTLSVDDKNIILASGALNDAAADGGGITLESGDGNKTINWVDSTDSWTFSENVDLAATKTYKINNVDVLTSTTLGSGVVNSSLTSVGTLTGLNVSGDLDVDGHTNLDNVSVTGVTTFTGTLTASGSLDLSGDLDVDGHTDLDNVNVSGAITATTFTGNLDGTVNTASQPNITSLGTLSSVTVSGDTDLNGNLDVDGTSELDNVNITGITTLSGTNVTGDLSVSGNANVVGVLTVGSSSITIDGSSDELKVGTGVTITHSNGIFVGETRVHSGGITAHDINTTGIITAAQFSGSIVGSSQTGITSVGTLDSLTVSGVINSNTDVRINGTGVLQSASDEAIALAIALG